jgi:hypothetical protein
MDLGWLVRRHGLISAVTLLIYLVSLPPALWLFFNENVTGSALLLLALGATGTVLGTLVFTLFIARGCPGTPRPRIKPRTIWYALVAIVVALHLYVKLTPLPHDVGVLIRGVDGGFALASMGFVVASGTPTACAFIDIVLGHTIFAKSRGFRRFVHRMGYWYMIIALVGSLVIIVVMVPPITIENVTYILISTGISLVIAMWADVFTLVLGIYLKHLIWKRKKPQ